MFVHNCASEPLKIFPPFFSFSPYFIFHISIFRYFIFHDVVFLSPIESYVRLHNRILAAWLMWWLLFLFNSYDESDSIDFIISINYSIIKLLILL